MIELSILIGVSVALNVILLWNLIESAYDANLNRESRERWMQYHKEECEWSMKLVQRLRKYGLEDMP